MLGEKKPVLCILAGDRKIDFNKIRERYSVKNVRMATPEEVRAYTGYGIGEVPPTARGNFEVLVDSRVLEQAEVYGGGGSPDSLLRITPQEIMEAGKAEAMDISKE